MRCYPGSIWIEDCFKGFCLRFFSCFLVNKHRDLCSAAHMGFVTQDWRLMKSWRNLLKIPDLSMVKFLFQFCSELLWDYLEADIYSHIIIRQMTIVLESSHCKHSTLLYLYKTKYVTDITIFPPISQKVEACVMALSLYFEQLFQD